MLVALGPAATMIISLELFEQFATRGDAASDPTRAIQSLAQAIAFSAQASPSPHAARFTG